MFRYVVHSNNFIAKDILCLRIRACSKPDVFNYLPGQYAAIGFKHNGVLSSMHCFSFSSSPSDLSILEFGIRVGGAFTQSLTRLEPEDEVFVMGPYGEFTIHPRETNRAVLIAGGIGVTPFVSMIRTSLTQQWPMKITLLYSCRTLEDAAYAKELIRYYKGSTNFDLFFFITQQDLGTTANEYILSGQITPEQLNKIVGGKYIDKTYYLCGPAGFMTAMRNNLLDKKVYSEKIISEEFSSTGSKMDGVSVQNKTNYYVLAGLIASLIFVAAVDLNKTATKLNANKTETTAEALPTSNNSTITGTPTQTAPPNSRRSRVSYPSNTYTPPTTGVS